MTTAEMQSPIGYTGVYAAWNTDLDNADADNDPQRAGTTIGTSAPAASIRR